MCLIGCQHGHLLSIRSFSGGYDLVLSCFIVGLLPVENDERRASLDGDHGQVGGGHARRTGHILITAILVGEVGEGGGDGARLVMLFIRLVDHMGSYKALLAHDVDLRCRQGPEDGGVFI